MILRRAFTTAERGSREFDRNTGRVLVTLGGGHTHGLAAMVLRGLDAAGRRDLEVTMVAGGASEELNELRHLIGELTIPVEVRGHVDDMPALMARSDLALSAGGSTCWELAFMGVPGLTITRAEHQRRITDALAAAGILTSLGDAGAVETEQIAGAVTALLDAPDRRAEMSRRGRALIDGHGAARVVGEIRALMEQR